MKYAAIKSRNMLWDAMLVRIYIAYMIVWYDYNYIHICEPWTESKMRYLSKWKGNGNRTSSVSTAQNFTDSVRVNLIVQCFLELNLNFVGTLLERYSLGKFEKNVAQKIIRTIMLVKQRLRATNHNKHSSGWNDNKCRKNDVADAVW